MLRIFEETLIVCRCSLERILQLNCKFGGHVWANFRAQTMAGSARREWQLSLHIRNTAASKALAATSKSAAADSTTVRSCYKPVSPYCGAIALFGRCRFRFRRRGDVVRLAHQLVSTSQAEHEAEVTRGHDKRYSTSILALAFTCTTHQVHHASRLAVVGRGQQHRSICRFYPAGLPVTAFSRC